MSDRTKSVPFRYVNVRDLCEITGQGRSTVYRHVKNGVLPPPTKIGGSALWRSDQLIQFFDSLGGSGDE